jgi:hypothetical protein
MGISPTPTISISRGTHEREKSQQEKSKKGHLFPADTMHACWRTPTWNNSKWKEKVITWIHDDEPNHGTNLLREKVGCELWGKREGLRRG